ncbi:alpha/beta hydrolase [Halomicroarcula sp. GCM10025710]
MNLRARRLSAWFYSPDPSPPWPLVVMAHGFSATKQMVADRYAEVFTKAGVAVLLYDHRGFGESGGEPRQQVNPWAQARGYRDAIAFATTHENVDSARIAVWGDSYSSGAALVVTALDTRVAALVVQVPALGAEVPSNDLDGSAREAMKQMVHTGSVKPAPDEVHGPIPVVWDDQDQRPSALKPETAFRWFNGYGTRSDTNQTNEVTIVRPKGPPWQPGLCAADVICPALFVVSPDDEMPRSAPTVARDAYERLSGPKERMEIPGGHFGLLYYPSETFDRASSAQSRFLVKRLRSESD